MRRLEIVLVAGMEQRGEVAWVVGRVEGDLEVVEGSRKLGVLEVERVEVPQLEQGDRLELGHHRLSH